MTEEKRAHARVAVPLNARVVRGAEELELGVRDISISGIFLYTRKPPGAVGSAITLKLALTAGIKPLLLQGKIVRVVPDPQGKPGEVLGIGVNFDPRGAEEERALLRLLDRAMLGRGTDNRAFPRVCYRLEVTCRTRDEIKAVMRDIGEGGVGLTVDRPFTKDEDVAIELAQGKGATLKLPGWVVSSDAITTQPGSFRIGVRFGKLSAGERAQLKGFLEALYRR